jgi:hypothetical protein
MNDDNGVVGTSPSLHRFVLSFHHMPCPRTDVLEVYLLVVGLAVPHVGRILSPRGLACWDKQEESSWMHTRGTYISTRKLFCDACNDSRNENHGAPLLTHLVLSFHHRPCHNTDIRLRLSTSSDLTRAPRQ